MVTTLTLPSSALGFSLDSNNQYKISVTLVMKEIIKLIKNLSVSSYLKHHKIKYKYAFYINGTLWKSIDYSELTNTDVSFSNENISSYLDSNKVKQTLSCTVEVSHPQFYCKLDSENYTFLAINKHPAQLKAKNKSTGQYETIGLSFNELSSGVQTDLNEIRWPIFNTENSAQQFVIPIGNVSSTRRNGSIRAEKFGGAAGQYFNLDTNPNSNKDFRSAGGTEYRYSDTFNPTLRYYESTEYVRTHYYYTTTSYYWTNSTLVSQPTLTTGSNVEGRYSSYSFDGWVRQYTFRHNYFRYSSIYAPNAQYIVTSNYNSPNTAGLPSSAEGFSMSNGVISTWGRDFTLYYTDDTRDITSTYWPGTDTFTTSGSVVVSGAERYGTDWVFDRWSFSSGTRTEYNCAGTGYPGYDRYVSSTRYSTPRRASPAYDAGNGRAYYDSGITHYTEEKERTEYPYNAPAVRYRYTVTTTLGYRFYDEWAATYKHPFVSYDFSLYRTYNTKNSTMIGALAGNERVYKRWWLYENRTNWSIDSNNELRYSTDTQVAITNDLSTYKTS